ncbi:MAG: hypothetical protein K2H89_03270, partial [Oscillospiraceae bacterium]|nr:hypothetical protein [Oscillospiraceae bacterium]
MGSLISEKYRKWEQICEQRFEALKSNEEELNQLFMRQYGLNHIISSEVKERTITVRKADLQREIKSLLSYAVGCFMGRYSLDYEGIAYAGGTWDSSRYVRIIPVADAIIPLGREDDFQNDILHLIIDFLRIVYGEDTLEQNLEFIAAALGGTGTSKEIIRDYFLKEFYADHCRIYRKCPIYWLFDAGRKNSFKALVYLHRYDQNTLQNLKINYICKIQQYDSIRLQNLTETNQKKLSRQAERLQNKIIEIALYHEKIDTAI